MAESSASESLTQRLATGRLTRAGILDRGSLQRTHDRLAVPPRTSVIDRLHRRIEPATTGTGVLPLVRVDRSIATDAPSMNPITSAPEGAAGVSAPTGEAAHSFGGEHVSRQTPSISRTGEFIARRVANTPGIVAAGSTTSGILKHAQSARDGSVPHAPIVAGVASTGTLQRAAELRSGHAASPAGVPAVATAFPISASGGQSTSSLPAIARSANAMVWRQAEGPVGSVASTPSLAASSIDAGVSEPLPVSGGVSPSSRAAQPTTPSVAVSTGELPRVSAGVTAHAASPVIWRKPESASPIPTVTALAATTSSPTIAAAPAQLVLRKPTVRTTASQSQSQSQPPSITPSSSQIVARTADESHRHAHAGPSTSSYDWNIDWITEQVGRRLARRLEIERERMGARSWR